VQRAVELIEERGWRIGNVDCTIFAEQPKLLSVKPKIRAVVAELLGIPVEAVNIKAKTGEKVGPIGRGEAIAADAIVLLLPANS
jgi:2-C-methyl-D-erythritol 2,4-cyclodiphosphate synthase